MRYAVTLTPDDNGTLLVAAPVCPRATFGEDREDAIELALMGAMAAREVIDISKAAAEISVRLSALLAAKVAVYQAMRAEQVGDAALAERLGVALPQIDRLLDMRHACRLDAIEPALAALGPSLTIVVAGGGVSPSSQNPRRDANA
jgi:antitoxin HicB